MAQPATMITTVQGDSATVIKCVVIKSQMVRGATKIFIAKVDTVAERIYVNKIRKVLLEQVANTIANVKVDTVKAIITVSSREFVKIRKVLMGLLATKTVSAKVIIALLTLARCVKANAVIGTETLTAINVL